MNLGIVGGTFDPTHIGHLVLARELAETLDLDRTLFVPAYHPPHKDPGGVSSAMHRVEMLRLAIENEPDFDLDLREISRGGKSFTYDTLKMIRQEHGSDVKIYFLIGADTLPELKSWHKAEELFSFAHFATAVRPGFSMERLEELQDTFSEKIISDLKAHLFETTPLGISSSQIRRNVFIEKSIRHLVPGRVEQYISDHSLYRSICSKRR